MCSNWKYIWLEVSNKFRKYLFIATQRIEKRCEIYFLWAFFWNCIIIGNDSTLKAGNHAVFTSATWLIIDSAIFPVEWRKNCCSVRLIRSEGRKRTRKLCFCYMVTRNVFRAKWKNYVAELELLEANLHNAPSEIWDSGPLERRRKWRFVGRETVSLSCARKKRSRRQMKGLLKAFCSKCRKMNFRQNDKAWHDGNECSPTCLCTATARLGNLDKQRAWPGPCTSSLIACDFLHKHDPTSPIGSLKLLRSSFPSNAKP